MSRHGRVHNNLEIKANVASKKPRLGAPSLLGLSSLGGRGVGGWGAALSWPNANTSNNALGRYNYRILPIRVSFGWENPPRSVV
jgi:hypothetical protein